MKLMVLLLVCLVASCGGRKTSVQDLAMVKPPVVVEDNSKPIPAVFSVERLPVSEPESFRRVVYFDFGRSAIRSDQDSLIGWLADACAGRLVVIYGGCCPIGDKEINYQLGLDRAKAVSGRLRGRATAIEVESWGELYPVDPRPSEYWKSRRAEIVVR
jgi:outer membrane protein OmpA-like peptidoglycan-associated protein